MNIRLAIAGDARGLFELDRSQAFSAHWAEPAWQAELAAPASRVWVAFLEEKMVGFICVRGAVDQYEITNLAVAPSHTRQGIGRALLRHALVQLQAQGAAHLTLEVSTANLPARALYKAAGLETLGVRKAFYADGRDALILGINL